jgi:aspartate beta-hydroxylase
VFFARQTGGTGIKSHTDFVNFIQTSHLGLDVPEGDCWIKVGVWVCGCKDDLDCVECL